MSFQEIAGKLGSNASRFLSHDAGALTAATQETIASNRFWSLARMLKNAAHPGDSFDSATATMLKTQDGKLGIFKRFSEAWKLRRANKKGTLHTISEWASGAVKSATEAVQNVLTGYGSKLPKQASELARITDDKELQFLASITESNQLKDALAAVFGGQASNEAVASRFTDANRATAQAVIDKLVESTDNALIVQGKAGMSATDKAQHVVDNVLLKANEANGLADAERVNLLRERFTGENGFYKAYEGYESGVTAKMKRQISGDTPIGEAVKYDAPASHAADASLTAVEARQDIIREAFDAGDYASVPDDLKEALGKIYGDQASKQTRNQVAQRVEDILKKPEGERQINEAKLLDALGITPDGQKKTP